MTTGPDGVRDDEDEFPVPERVILEGEFVALLLTESVPVTVPEVVGVNFTLKERTPPGLRVTGTDVPETENGPETPIALMVMDCELLPLVSVTLWPPLVLPTVCEPKAKLAGLAVSCKFAE